MAAGLVLILVGFIIGLGNDLSTALLIIGLATGMIGLIVEVIRATYHLDKPPPFFK